MSKLLVVGVLAVALFSIAACKNTTEQQDPATLSPPADAAVPEPDMNTSTIETVENDMAVPEPMVSDPMPSTPVQSLGASSSGLGR